MIGSHFSPGRSETPLRAFASIPFRRDLYFINRGDILDQVGRRCSEPASRVALVGVGGVGKSQLAIEFAQRIAARPADTRVFWIHAGTRARMEEGFQAIVDSVGLSGRDQPKADIPWLAHSWLSDERNGRWVMVLDGADDGDVFYGTSGRSRERRPLAMYLPHSRNGCILITTRDRVLASRLSGNYRSVIEVGPMTEADALCLLERRLGSLSDPDVAMDPVLALDLFPLAISQAAAYIQAGGSGSSLKKYLTEFRKSELESLWLPGYDNRHLYRDEGVPNSVLTTWKISFDHIRYKRPSAADLLSLMSFFDQQGIPGWVLRLARRTVDVGRTGPLEETSDSEADVSDTGDSDTSDSESGGSEPCYSDGQGDGEKDGGIGDDIALLRAYNLLTAHAGKYVFDMHGLVRLSTRKWLETTGQQASFMLKYIEQIALSFPTGDYRNFATCRRLFAHVEAAFNNQPGDNGLEQWAALLHNGGWYAWLQGEHVIAEGMARKAKWAREKKLGKENPATLASTSLLALVLMQNGLYKEAELLFVQVAEMRKMKLGAEHPDTLTSINNLASALWNQGQWEEAGQLLVHVTETRKRKLGADHPDTLTSANNLALTWRSQGRHADALVLMKDCAQARRRVLGPGHPYTISSVTTFEQWDG